MLNLITRNVNNKDLNLMPSQQCTDDLLVVRDHQIGPDMMSIGGDVSLGVKKTGPCSVPWREKEVHFMVGGQRNISRTVMTIAINKTKNFITVVIVLMIDLAALHPEISMAVSIMNVAMVRRNEEIIISITMIVENADLNGREI
jgi:hypothetical protein